MKRNIDLIRGLLQVLEDKPDDTVITDFTYKSYSKTEVMYHYLLLYEAGFIRAECELTKTGRVIRLLPFSLTWDGHEFIELTRNDTLWKKAKDIAVEQTGTLSIDLIKSLLRKLMVVSVDLLS